MNFQLEGDSKEIRDLARRVAEEKLRPTAFERRFSHEVPQENLTLLGELGLLGVCLPEAHGGEGRPEIDAIHVIEQITWGCPFTAEYGVFAITGPASFIAKFGTEEQKAKYIPPVCRGEERWSISLTEPEAGSALTDMQTHAEIVGDVCVLNGSKIFCSLAGDSHHFLVFCRFGPTVKDIGAVIVHRDTPGFSMSPPHEYISDGHWHELFFDDAQIPLEDVLLDGDGMRKLLAGYSLERCGAAAFCCGIAQIALDFAAAYAEERSQFGRRISDFQMVQQKLADMYIRLESARLLTYKAIADSADGLPSKIDSSAAKVAATEAVGYVCFESMQIHGGTGMTKELPLEWLYRVVRPYQVAGGTNEIHRSMIAAEVIGRRIDHRPAKAVSRT